MTGKKTNLWWGPPKNFSERKHERKIGWLELFYDLVYVAAIAQLTHHLAEHPSWSEAGYSFLLFALIFWAWVNGSQYYDLHGNDGIRTRLLTFWQMLAVAASAITISDAFKGHHEGLAITLVMAQFIITYLWWSVGLYDPSHRILNRFYTVNYVIAFALLSISIFVSNHTAVMLWIIALVFNLTPSLVGARTIIRVLKERGQVFTASAAIVERFGLFTIIVLAESILGTVTGIAEVRDKDATVWFAFIIAILIAFLLWSIYFDLLGEQQTKKGYCYLQWLLFLHFPLLACLGVVGACMKVLLAGSRNEMHTDVQWMFCVSLSVIILMIVSLTKIMEEDEEVRSYIGTVSRLLICAATLILFIPLFGHYLNALAFLSIIAIILFVPVFVGMRRWVQFKFFSNK